MKNDVREHNTTPKHLYIIRNNRNHNTSHRAAALGSSSISLMRRDLPNLPPEFLCNVLHTAPLGLRQVDVKIEPEKHTRHHENRCTIGVQVFLEEWRES